MAVGHSLSSRGGFSVTRHFLGSPGRGGEPVFRMVQLTDLHLQTVGGHEERVAAAVSELGPDLVLFTGDSIDRGDRIAELSAFLGLLDEQIPKVAILGNWERRARVDERRLRGAYEAANAQLLINQSLLHRHAGHDVLITGLDDEVGGWPNLMGALDGFAPHRHHIVLAHCPIFRDEIYHTLRRAAGLPRGGVGRLSKYTPQYVLSGHTHGGQVAFRGWAPIRPRGSGRYLSGWYRDVRPFLYVSRGLGTSVLPIRLGAPPEVAFFELNLASQA